MKVVFGGSFNPPTIAHEAVIDYLAHHYDEVILLPNGNQYQKPGLIDQKMRLEMLDIIAEAYDNVSISPIEFKRSFKGTYQSLRDLNHPLFVCGDDCLMQLDQWIKPHLLVSENQFLIFTRHLSVEQVYQWINHSWLKPYASHFEVIQIDFPDVSSSTFRHTHQKEWVNSKLYHYIETHGLYQKVEESMYKENYVKIALVTPKVHLGHPLENAKEMIALAAQVKQASFVVFPELSLTGYTLGDWVMNRELLHQTRDALDKVRQASGQQIWLVGLPFEYAGVIYNCAAVIQNQHILGIIPKSNLPTSGEFYESRYFASGASFLMHPVTLHHIEPDHLVPFGNVLFQNQVDQLCFGVEICGDLWGIDKPHHWLYQKGADIVFNLSASTYYLGKKKVRHQLVSHASHQYKGAYVYVSNGPSDSTSDMTYSGHQIACVCGETLLNQETLSLDSVYHMVDIDLEYIRYARSSDNYARTTMDKTASFVPFELTESSSYLLEQKPDPLPFVPQSEKELAEIIDMVCVSLKHRLDYVGCDKVIIGVSGGLDSTLALLFAYTCYQKYHLSPRHIIAVTMPGLGTGSKSKNIAHHLMDKLGVDAREVSIKKEAFAHLKLLEHSEIEKDVTYENVQARLRTMYLMNLANQEKGIVLGTGDMSEIALGWSTFNGDQMSMYGLNSNLPKTTVRALVRYFSMVYPQLRLELRKVCQAVISPELTGADQATEERIGKYEINDFMMYHIFTRGASQARVLYLLHHTFDLTQEEALQYYKRLMERFKHNQFKRLTMAEGIKVFSFTFNPRGECRFPGDMK